MILRFLYLLSFIVYFSLALGRANNNQRSKLDRLWKNRKESCEREDCVHLIPEEAYNCVNNCTSRPCFEEVYAQNPLEDGEIDLDRNRQFTSCLRLEADKQRRLNNKRSAA